MVGSTRVSDLRREQSDVCLRDMMDIGDDCVLNSWLIFDIPFNGFTTLDCSGLTPLVDGVACSSAPLDISGFA